MLIVIEGKHPSSIKTAKNLLQACGSTEGLEAGLVQVAREALEWFYERHRAGEAARLAEIFLAGVAMALYEKAGIWPSAEMQDQCLLKAGRTLGGDIERAVRALIHAERKIAEQDREEIRREIAREKGIPPDEVRPEDIEEYFKDAFSGLLGR